MGSVPATYQRATVENVFASLDGSISGPDTFSGPIEKILRRSASNWPVTNFKQPSVPLSSFPTLPPHVVIGLTIDQFFVYKLYRAVTHRKVDDDVTYLEVGPVVHLRCLTLGCRVLTLFCVSGCPSFEFKHISSLLR